MWCNERDTRLLGEAVVTVLLIMVCWLCGSIPAAVVVGTVLRVRREEMERGIAFDAFALDPTPSRGFAITAARAEAQYWSLVDLGPMSEIESPR
jgi:hypothetical protein